MATPLVLRSLRLEMKNYGRIPSYVVLIESVESDGLHTLPAFLNDFPFGGADRDVATPRICHDFPQVRFFTVCTPHKSAGLKGIMLPIGSLIILHHLLGELPALTGGLGSLILRYPKPRQLLQLLNSWRLVYRFHKTDLSHPSGCWCGLDTKITRFPILYYNILY